MICFSFHRLWTYSCSISEYTAAHSLGVGANCRAGTIDRADRLVRGAICGSFIGACIKKYHEEVVGRKGLDPLKLEALDPSIIFIIHKSGNRLALISIFRLPLFVCCENHNFRELTYDALILNTSS